MRVRSGWVWVGPEMGQFIVLHYYAVGPKITDPWKFILIFIHFFVKVLELFECHRGYLYMTANRSFIRFAHSY